MGGHGQACTRDPTPSLFCECEPNPIRSGRASVPWGLDGSILLCIFLISRRAKWLCGAEVPRCPGPTSRAATSSRSGGPPWGSAWPCGVCMQSLGFWGFCQNFYHVSPRSCSAPVPYSRILHHSLLPSKPQLLSGAVSAFPCALCPASLLLGCFLLKGAKQKQLPNALVTSTKEVLPPHSCRAGGDATLCSAPVPLLCLPPTWCWRTGPGRCELGCLVAPAHCWSRAVV